MNILAIDIGTQTGWARVDRAGRVTGGSESFSPRKLEGPGARWMRFRAFLTDCQRAGEINAVYYERVLRHTAVQAAHVYGGFEAMLQAWCEANRVRLVGVPVTVIKKDWTGKGNADKAAMLAEAKRRGLNPVDDNHADALALLAYARVQELDQPFPVDESANLHRKRVDESAEVHKDLLAEA
jgi:Holliday junction resolvasome RuvABC endonuclease subunit